MIKLGIFSGRPWYAPPSFLLPKSFWMEQRGEHQEMTAGDTGASEQVRGTAVKPIQRVERASQRALSTTVTACGRGADPFPSSRARRRTAGEYSYSVSHLLLVRVLLARKAPPSAWKGPRIWVCTYRTYIHTYIHTRYGDGYCMVLGNLLMGASPVCN